MSNKVLTCISLIFFSFILKSQDCSITIKGTVVDLDTKHSLEAVNIFIKESQQGTITDTAGNFVINQLCAGEYHLIISHVGCETQQYYIQTTSDTTLLIEMEHSSNVLDGITVTGSTTNASTKNINTLNEQNIQDNASESLSNLISSIAGVSSIKNGSSIAKPIVHGLYGNRLSILNNGITQSGQQWGADHSPEIDPLVANKIKVIKGTSALEYAGSNLGSVVLIEPQRIEKEPHLHGKAHIFYETNGRTYGSNIQLQKYNENLSWKINGTFKKGGDKKTPDYFLNNTGIREANIALQLEKRFTDKWHSDLYFSSFNTQLGILRGSHISNLTDLQSALLQETPFFTEPDFSYLLEAPRQQVNHQLLKLHSKYFLAESESVDVTIAAQLNDRKEFDIRRGGRENTPALSLQLFSIYGEVKYQKEYDNNLKLSAGIQNTVTDNTNDPETGILPLIPDYRTVESGAYTVLTKSIEKSLIEIGLRYDYIYQNIVQISNSTPRQILRFTNNYNNINGSIGWTYRMAEHYTFSLNAGYSTRSPGINELYSGGLHQGVSGIEEGNTQLAVEKAFKTTMSLTGGDEESVLFEVLLYRQAINDYIYLNPQNETRLTIRGAFPVFRYEQTDAIISGIDASFQYKLSKSLYTKWVYSYIHGQDRGNNLSLINLPSNDLLGSLIYQSEGNLSIGETQLDNIQLELSNRYVFEQTGLLIEQDFVAPPDAYNLLSINASTNIQFKSIRTRWVFKIDNLLNVSYRDYLNRQRYFADEPGINFTLGVTINI